MFPGKCGGRLGRRMTDVAEIGNFSNTNSLIHSLMGQALFRIWGRCRNGSRSRSRSRSMGRGRGRGRGRSRLVTLKMTS